MANLARSLTQHAEDSFELADTILVGIVSRLEVDGFGPASLNHIQSFLPNAKINSRVRGIFIYSDTGQWLATTEQINYAALNNSDRDYFQHHRNSPDRGSLIGRPVQSRSGGQWIITISRRLNGEDGRFAGVALVTIDASYFGRFYERFDIGPNGAISLLNADGIILARSNDTGSVGRDLSGTRLFRELGERPAASVYYFKSPIDGIERLSFYMLSNRYPIVIVATKARDDVLALWRRDAMVRLSIVLGLTSLLGAVGFFIVKQMGVRQKMSMAIVAKEADFRLLAEQSSDIVMRISLDETILYVSPSVTAILGWNPGQLIGTQVLAGLNAEDLPVVQKVVSRLKLGEMTEARISYRSMHRAHREIWMETTLRATHSPESGEVDGVVAISRDITERKDHEVNLATLATTDGLTGLANRRHFDESLIKEWARAKRDGTEISLILIDVDHFKKFNDSYGHPAGDTCLKSLAGIFQLHAKRPLDLAARYGGEEFAILLPNTGLQGGVAIGEMVRSGLRDLAILHELNLPSKKVTVSLGVATVRPAETTVDCASLILMADRALYDAKNEGRDRLIVSSPIATDIAPAS